MFKNSPEADSFISTPKTLPSIMGAEDQAFRIEQFWDVLPGILWKLSPEGRLLDVNSAALSFSGFSKKDFVGRLLDEFLVDGFSFKNITKALPSGGKSLGVPACVRRSDGSKRDITIDASRVEGDEVIYCTVNDRSADQQTEDHAHAEGAFFEAPRSIAFTQSLDGIVTMWSEDAEGFYGLKAEDVLGKRIPERLSLAPEIKKRAMAELLRAGEWSGQVRIYSTEGQEVEILIRWVLLKSPSGAPNSILVLAENIAELKQAKEDRLRAHRHECVGTLAGGIAHDLNNVLQPISMCLDLLRKRLGDAESQEMLDAVESNLQRATELVRQILTFSSGARTEQVAIDITELITRVSNFIRPTFPKTIKHQVSVQKNIHMVLGNETQLEQVLINFCVNARDAMPGGGSLQLDASNFHVDDQFARLHPHATTGDFVRITVRDTGHGIPRSIRKKIFEPFFTTKSPDLGTGLGLATAVNIIRSHGGFLALDTEEGCGSSFHAFLPALASEVHPKPASPTPDKTQAAGHGEAILIVDDESTVLKVMTRSLEKSGYKVLAAGDGEEGYALYSKHREEVRLVITDLAMPGMDGPALIAALKKINPAIKVICTSGLGSYTEQGSLTELGVLAILSKPCNSRTILQAIQDTLNTPSLPA